MKRSINVEFLLGKESIGIFEIPKNENDISRILDIFRSNIDNSVFVVGLRFNTKCELFGHIRNSLNLSDSKGTYKWFCSKLVKNGFTLKSTIAVLPDVTNPRFCYDYHDHDSHKFLVDDILYPRRYSLKIYPMVLLFIYKYLIKFKFFSHILCRGVYLRFES